MRYLVIFICLVMFTGCLPKHNSTQPSYQSKTIRVYDKNHKHTGYIMTGQYKTRYYDKDLHLIGYSK